jgi:hypothetical protein
MNSKDNWNWIFKGFVDTNKNDLIQDWYDKQTSAVRSEFDVLLQGMRRRSHHEWSAMGDSKDLKGKSNKGLIELRFKVERVPYRPIGIFGPERGIFTILIVAGKSDLDAKCKLAIERKTLIELNPREHTNESSCLSELTRKTPK